ncbi:MAG: glutathione S-transferase N-terminal domain-containing protein [Halofilum sp. (in: g-proteobacteria)]|nr:glutathione S-transferase N-terminal domain-containing protein [Halofilum sp. (in: g-proteobacteria)]
MDRKLYDLAAADPACRFSQHCWRVRLALYHKGLDYDAEPWRFTDKEAIAFAGTQKVPVLVDGERVIHDSWEILGYLQDTYAQGPSLFGGPDARAQVAFFRHWTERVVHAGLAPMIVRDIWARLHERDQAYFRETREARFGRTLEALAEETPQRLPAFREALAPLRATVEAQAFVAGDARACPTSSSTRPCSGCAAARGSSCSSPMTPWRPGSRAWTRPSPAPERAALRRRP